MRISTVFMVTLALLSLGSPSLADTIRSESRNNLIDQRCENASEVSIRVVNMDGQCQAFWKCDSTAFEVKCGSSQCECQHDSASFINKIKYESCDSDRLDICFNVPQ